ncbi:serine/threonine protein kinase [Polaromonas sp. CF318]|uniref:serine/threonine-protein kinase n=1 Tax=Polaromonas sp. CF318 TaxID=1144318 RepID=UPI0002712D78|nr:serine/threonine-protein kinase [Polaromonas sp. CF318]EJL90019.1 serine/threonine protein kinase [Polaromonas sp. CF318]
MSLKKLGRYDLINVLGKGAMGLVYEGRDPNLDRRVAIKTIKVENLSEEAAAEYEVRFRTEARSAARLQHPHIVSVYDSDRDGDIAFLVMEFVDGDDLKHHLDKGNLYTLEQTLGIMGDLLSALEYAHRQSIVHRDIKPANLLIETSGRVKLTDFGVARIQDSGEATRTQGSMVGTLKYMSPEQVQGRPIDARADLFAAGIVLYQLLTGKRPFDGDTDFATIQQIVGHTPAPPSSFNPKLPAAIDAVVAKALAKSRDQRYASAQDFLTALQAAAREAADTTVQPPAIPVGPGSNSTWTSTLLAGEALVGLQSGTSADIPMVTQELELVYWKEIKESMDVEDIQGFLARFPSGIYADLARRRLKKMGVPGGEDSDIGRRLGTGTLIVPRPAGQDAAAGMTNPGMTNPGATNPNATNPGVTNPGVTNPGITNPGITRPAVTHPGVSSPGATNPGVTHPGSATDLAWKALEEAAAQAPVAPPPLPAAPAADDPDATRLGAPVMAVPPVPAVPQPQSEPSEWPETVFSDAGPVTVQLEAAEAKTKADASPVAAASAAAAVPEARPESSRKRRSAEPGASAKASAASPPPYLVWGGIALVALVILGVGVRQLSKPKVPALAAAQPVAAATDDGPARPAAPAVPQPAAQAAQAQPAAAAAPAPAAAASTAAVAAPLSPASKAAAAQAIAAKKAALEKERLAKQQAAQAKSGGSTTAPAAVEHAPAPSPSANAGNPRQACEDRMLIGFQICMNEQCAKPAFTNHPVCVERRAMEQRRREAEQLRR